MKTTLGQLSLVASLSIMAMPVFAAQPIDLSQHQLSYLNAFTSKNAVLSNTTKGSNIKEVSEALDINQTKHIRIRQSYLGHRVLGADGIIHTPHGKNKKLQGLLSAAGTTPSTMNGKIYQDLNKDLQPLSKTLLSTEQTEKAFAKALDDYQEKNAGKVEVRSRTAELLVFVDEQNKAHWAFQVVTTVKLNGRIAQPSYLLDATDLRIYKSWNNLKTSAREQVQAGGLGGNERIPLVYEGTKGKLAGFEVERDATTNQCYMTNSLVQVIDARNFETPQFECQTPSAEHNNLYWSGNFDAINGGYSPDNDVMYSIKTINEMYQSWYQIPFLSKNGQSVRVNALTHHQMGNNAYWDDQEQTMAFGDGGDELFPLTSLGITAHELGHAFTSQYSNLAYEGQSGGMNEAFSDMAHAAVLYYVNGEFETRIAADIFKTDGFALRYMDKPSKDCSLPHLECSIDTANEYYMGLDVHNSSGVYNHAFYFLANTDGWNVKKAFDVMVQANRFYWTEFTDFDEGACGVMQAAKDYHYDVQAVSNAFTQVGVDTTSCN